MNKFLAIAISTTLLTACQQGVGNYENNTNTYDGAAIGAVVGGVAGIFSNDKNRFKNGAIGAGIGALAGGGIGAYMDSQEAAMRQATQGTGIEVEREGNDLMLNLPSNITFATNSSSIQSSLAPTLRNVGSILRDYPQTIVEIYGHTDSTGSEIYNLDLSDKRADAVANYLSDQGLTQRIVTTGVGEAQPIASNDTESGRAQNRRVEIKISPVTQ